MLRRAMCAPTSADEQAVSTATEGPVKPNVYDARPGATLGAEPSARKVVLRVSTVWDERQHTARATECIALWSVPTETAWRK